jgi:hypothetical protein
MLSGEEDLARELIKSMKDAQSIGITCVDNNLSLL